MKKRFNLSVNTHDLKLAASKSKRGRPSYLLKTSSISGSHAWVHFLEDPIFNSYLFNKFINMFVKQGKKQKIHKIIYSLFGMSHKKRVHLNLFFIMAERLKPGLVCVRVRSGPNINMVPMPTTEAKAYRIGLQYIYKAIKDRAEDQTLEKKIFNEFEFFFKEQGYVNPYWKSNNDSIVTNGHLRHYRRFGVY